MRNKLFRKIALAMSFITMLGTLPVNAYELDSQGMSIESVEYQNSADEDFTNSAEVFAEISSTYQVTIPKVIVLSGESKSAEYQVSVEGDIAGYETIFVKPDNTVNLYSKNKEMQIGTISQDKTGWTTSTIDAIGNGLINANTITAGRWSGTFNFEIFLNRVLDDVIEPGHEHNPGEVKIENEVKADCVNAGSYDEVVYCTECYSEMSRKTKIVDALGHDYVDGYCSRCGEEEPKSERIDLIVNGVMQTGYTVSGNAYPSSDFMIVYCRPGNDGATISPAIDWGGRTLHVVMHTTNTGEDGWTFVYGGTSSRVTVALNPTEYTFTGGSTTTPLKWYHGNGDQWVDVRISDMWIE